VAGCCECGDEVSGSGAVDLGTLFAVYKILVMVLIIPAITVKCEFG
jgi:hypothetical protein